LQNIFKKKKDFKENLPFQRKQYHSLQKKALEDFFEVALEFFYPRLISRFFFKKSVKPHLDETFFCVTYKLKVYLNYSSLAHNNNSIVIRWYFLLIPKSKPRRYKKKIKWTDPRIIQKKILKEERVL